MKNLLTRGGIEIIAVFIGISGGLWSEKQSELNKIIKSEETALISIKEALVSDSTSVYWIIKSLEKEQENTDLFLKHISKDTVLSEKELNTRMWDLAYFQYLVQDKSIYESQIKNAGKKIVQVDSVSAAISNVYDYLYKHLDNIFIMQKELSTKTVEAFTDAGGYMDSKRFSITNSLNIDQSAMFSSSFQNLKFISQLTFHYDTNFFIKRQYERGLKIISSAIESIETYLDSKK
mgnify:FL=1|tara:strand:- start:775 stop:1476 length:702 start_codon:yes stop_codon:yes gene_type:complete